MLARNILIFHSGALGDFILSWPLALAMGRVMPQSRVFYVCPADKGFLTTQCLGVETNDIEAGWSPMWTGEAPGGRAGELLARSHTIVSFVANEDSNWAKGASKAQPSARALYLSTKPPETMHATDWLLQQLESDGFLRHAVYHTTQHLRSEGLRPNTVRDGGLLIHPGSGGRLKCWPLEKFVAVARSALDAGMKVTFVLGEVERERFTSEQLEQLKAEYDTAEPESLVHLAMLLERATVYLGNDSGPSHLAAMLGTPTVALFVASNPVQWSPVGPRVSVLTGNELDEATVFDSVRAFAGSLRVTA